MNYQEELRLIAASLLELESLFHGLYNIDIPMHKDKKTGIRRYQVLKILEKEEEQNLTDLNRFLHMRKNSCSELLDRMVKDGLLERNPSREDRRKTFFRLTGTGRRAIGEFEDLFVGRISKLFQDLPDTEVKRFVDSLETIIGIAKKINM